MKIKHETFGISPLAKAALNETSWYIRHSILYCHLQHQESTVNPMLEVHHYTMITNIIGATSRIKRYFSRYGVLTAERHYGDGMQLVL